MTDPDDAVRISMGNAAAQFLDTIDKDLIQATSAVHQTTEDLAAALRDRGYEHGSMLAFVIGAALNGALR